MTFSQALSPSAVNLPILQVHGDSDSVVDFDWGQGSHQFLKVMITDPIPNFIKIRVSIHT